MQQAFLDGYRGGDDARPDEMALFRLMGTLRKIRRNRTAPNWLLREWAHRVLRKQIEGELR